MVQGCIVDELCCVLKDVDADELPSHATLDEYEGIRIDFLGPPDVPPKLHVGAPTSSCIETAVAMCYSAWAMANQVPSGVLSLRRFDERALMMRWSSSWRVLLFL